MAGRTSKDIATEKFLYVIRGVVAKGHALHWELVFQVSTARKKMCMFKVYTVESIHG